MTNINSMIQNFVNKNNKYTNNWVPIKEITNGRIILDNGLSVSGVKISPKNIFILDSQLQENIIISLKNLYNLLDFEFWIISAGKPVDINSYLAQLEMLYNNVNMPSRKKLIREDIDKANLFMSNNVADTEYFILFKEKNIDLIYKKIKMIVNGLASASIESKQINNQDLRLLIDNFLNGGISTEFGTVMF